MKTKMMIAGAVATASLALAGCVTDPTTGKRTISTKGALGGVIGGVGGYLLGDLIGGKNDRTAKIVGAGVGAVAGTAVGTYMDQQAKELQEETAGTGVDVTRTPDGGILLNMPSGITFPVDSYGIQPQFQTTLNNVAETLVKYPSTYLDVYGHTDSTGSDAYNMTLSQNRAQSVANYLVGRGVQSARLATKGYGETQPIATNATAEGRAANRRVEIRIVPITQNDVNAVR